jgi:hypothetical protein
LRQQVRTDVRFAPKAEAMAVAHMTFPNPAVSLRQMRGLLKRRRKHLLRGGSVSLAMWGLEEKSPVASV